MEEKTQPTPPPMKLQPLAVIRLTARPSAEEHLPRGLKHGEFSPIGRPSSVLGDDGFVAVSFSPSGWYISPRFLRLRLHVCREVLI